DRPGLARISSRPPRKRPMPLEAVFLDLGKTLLTERPTRAELYAETARRHGAELAVEEVRRRMTAAHEALPRAIGGAFRYSDEWFRAFQGAVFPELARDARAFELLSSELFARFEDPRSFVLYPGARELVAALRARRLRTGLISNWSERLPRL